jgi:carboxypeptidase Q
MALPLTQTDCLGKHGRYGDLMKVFLLTLAAFPSFALAQTIDPAALRDQALKDDTAWQIIEDLTTEVGPRLAGSEAEARARDWALKRLKTLGFSNVRIEPFEIEGWERGIEQGEILAPYSQPLVLTALGHSGATPAKGLTGEIVGFPSLAALEAAPASAVAGKIVFIWHRMGSAQDGSNYRAFGPIRFKGPSVAASKGAAAIVIRSLGTNDSRVPHTGVTGWSKGQRPIPAAALSVADAEQLERLLAKGGPVRLHLLLTPRATGKRPSGNVIAEIPGRDPEAGIVLVGGHLDSWDLGTGAIDDAAGVAITAAAAHLVGRGGQPLRTIRVVWFGSEEVAAQGGDSYKAAHAKEKHVMAAESDFGADRIWQFDTKVADASSPVLKGLENLLMPLGIVRGTNEADPGADVEPLADSGVPIVSLRQDGRRYFELHHTAEDTLDKIDSSQLQQNVAAWTTLLSVAANDANWPEKPVIQSKSDPK